MSAADRALVAEVLGRVQAHPPVIAVVGDAMLDAWLIGPAERISREAAAPVVRLRERRDAPGGAANAAVNVAALGARVRLAALVGDDASGDRVTALLERAGVELSALVVAADLPTTTKTRVTGAEQVLVRVDEQGEPGPAHRRALLAAARRARAEADAELICDYGAGALHPATFAAAAGTRSARVPDVGWPRIRVVDAHDPAAWAGLRPTAITPSAREAERLLGLPLGTGPERAAAVTRYGDRLRAASGAECVAVTLDRDGSILVSAAGTTASPAVPAPERHANGAGDTFAAGFVVALAVGVDAVPAARFAQLCADVVVRDAATTVCTASALRASVADRTGRILNADALAQRLERERAAGRRIVFTNGCFDILHGGHAASLAQAKELGDVLVVALNDDASVRRLKGEGRPLNPATERAQLVAGLAAVDYVTLFDADTPAALLEQLRPDVYTKGGDYTPEMLEETAIVRGYGGEVRIVDYVAGRSTHEVISRARELGRR